MKALVCSGSDPILVHRLVSLPHTRLVISPHQNKIHRVGFRDPQRRRRKVFEEFFPLPLGYVVGEGWSSSLLPLPWLDKLIEIVQFLG